MKRFLEARKGQVFSADALIGMLVFLFTLGIVFFYVSQVSERSSAFENSISLKSSAFNALGVLVGTGGSPEDWEFLGIESINAFGISSSYGIVNSGKLSKFAELSGTDYNSVKKILGLQKFDFSFSLQDLNGSTAFTAGLQGSGREFSFKTSRIVAWNNEIFTASLEVFK